MGGRRWGGDEQKPDLGESCGCTSEHEPDDECGRRHDTKPCGVSADISALTVQMGQSGGIIRIGGSNGVVDIPNGRDVVAYAAAGSSVPSWLDNLGID